MTSHIILDNEYALSIFHVDEGILQNTFHKPVHGDDLRNILVKAVETLKRYKATKWLSDARNITAPISEADKEWTLQTWLPSAIEAGWQYWALVVPDSQEMRVNLKEFVDFYYERGVRVMVFLEVADAREWLKVQDNNASSSS